MDDGQIALISYARLYERVDEMPIQEKPDDSIINDDEKFDRWYEEYEAELLRKFRKQKAPTQAQLAAIPSFGG